MAKSKKQKEMNELSEKCAYILIEFANADTLEDALENLHFHFLLHFGISIFDQELPFKWTRKAIQLAQQRLIKLFDELQEDKMLEKSDIIQDYNYDFFMLCESAIASDARDSDEIDKLACFDGENQIVFQAVLAFCVHYYIQDNKRKPIFKCKFTRCSRYYVAEKITKKFCCENHKIYYHRSVSDTT